MICNIAIPAPPELAEKAILLSQSLEKFDSVFTLDGFNFIPHLTLYMTEFDDENLPKMASELKDLLSSCSPFNLTAEKFFMNAANYIDIQYKNSPELKDLHYEVINKLSRYRKVNEISPDKYKGPDAEVMYQNAVDFGYAIGKDLYRPHVTLSKLNEANPDALSSLDWDDFDFRVPKIGIFEADDLGCCRRKIEHFDLTS